MDVERIEARYSPAFRRGWVAFWSVGVAAGAALILAGLGLGLAGVPVAPWLLGGFGLMLALPFGAMLAFSLHRLSDPRPVIRVGPEGYHDRRLGAPIPWAAIRAIGRRRTGSRILLQIEVDAPERFLGQAGMLKGPMLRLNPAMGFPALASMLQGLDPPQECVAAAAEAWWAASRGGAP